MSDELEPIATNVAAQLVAYAQNYGDLPVHICIDGRVDTIKGVCMVRDKQTGNSYILVYDHRSQDIVDRALNSQAKAHADALFNRLKKRG